MSHTSTNEWFTRDLFRLQQGERGFVMRAVALLLVLGVTLMPLAGCSKKAPTPPQSPPEAGFVVVATQTVPLFIELPARATAFETADVRPQVSGLIKARRFTEGGTVRAGELLYQIDPSLYRATSAQAQANLANAQAAQVAAQALANRYRPLAAMQAVSQQDYTNAVASSKQTSSVIAQNQAALNTANINLAFADITAPISGRIGTSLYTTGALVTSGQVNPLATIQRLDPIFVDIQQSSASLLALRRRLAKPGTLASSAAVTLKLDDGSDYGLVGRIEFAQAVVNPTTGAVLLRARFPNPHAVLLPGMFIVARLGQETAENAILVPEAGITHDPRGGATALVVGPGNKAVLRNVVAPRTVGADWLITSGLNTGDRLIVEGVGRIKPNQVVKPVAAGSKPSPPPPPRLPSRHSPA